MVYYEQCAFQLQKIKEYMLSPEISRSTRQLTVSMKYKLPQPYVQTYTIPE